MAILYKRTRRPRCPRCKREKYVTRHSVNKRPDGTPYSRWLCRKCGSSFLRRVDRRREGNYKSKYQK